MFKQIIFWCEFPQNLDFNKLNFINFKCSVYFACKNKKEFLKYKNKTKNKNIKVGAWPVLPKKEGYWFSSFSSKKSIDKLKEFKGIPLKIDIEPPLPNFNFNYFKFISYLLKYSFKKGENYEYLNNTIKKLSKNTDIILSTYPFPYFILKKYGFNKDLETKINYFIYPTVIPKIFRPISWMYYKNLVKSNRINYIAIGLLSQGILKNEPIYKSIDNFKKDLEILKKLNLENIVIYSIEGLLKKQNYKNWLDCI